MGIGQAQPANFSAVSVYFNAFDFGGIDADCTAVDPRNPPSVVVILLPDAV